MALVFLVLLENRKWIALFLAVLVGSLGAVSLSVAVYRSVYLSLLERQYYNQVADLPDAVYYDNHFVVENFDLKFQAKGGVGVSTDISYTDSSTGELIPGGRSSLEFVTVSPFRLMQLGQLPALLGGGGVGLISFLTALLMMVWRGRGQR